MSETVLAGGPASPGLALGRAWRLPDAVDTEGPVALERRERECDTALAALGAAVEALSAMAPDLAPHEAEIVETGALMGQDPALLRAVSEAVLIHGMTAAQAIIAATGDHADAIAAVGDEMLAARADDVRSLGRRAARIAGGAEVERPPGEDAILIARDLGPADVAEHAAALAGIVLAGGGATAHAAIVARSLGLPMVVGVGSRALEVQDGTLLAVDGGVGTAIIEPCRETAARTEAGTRARRRADQRAGEHAHEPALTIDGVRVAVLVNVASAAELTVGVAAGAEGIGLLRTELGFLDARAWPTERDHTARLAPILAGLEGRPAVVRLLDFGADKCPPFLHGVAERGLALLLAHSAALRAQLRAILRASERHDVRVLLPLVNTAEQVSRVRAMLSELAATAGIAQVPPLGAMIETVAGSEDAPAIAASSDFLSIGTNDLTAGVLEADRFAAGPAGSHDPRVLRAIARTVAAGHEAGVHIGVCGEAASEATTLPLLVGLGVDELSVGAAQVGQVREWVRGLDRTEMAGLARSALTMDGPHEVERAVGTLTAAG